MPPGQKRDFRKEKKKNGNFSVKNKTEMVKTVHNTFTKKAKEKSVHKKKLKEQTSKWIEDVNETFTDLQPKLVADGFKEKKDKTTDRKSSKENHNQKSDVTEEELTNTITNIANLLDQS